MERRIFLKLTGSATFGVMFSNELSAFAKPDSGYLAYNLQDGWVDNWLLVGPQLIKITDARYKWEPDIRGPIMKKYHQEEPQVFAPFLEGAKFKVDDAALSWRYYACQDDHLVDLAAWYGNSRFVRVWAYLEINSPDDREVGMHFFANGPSDVWVNGKHALKTETFDYFDPLQHAFAVKLNKGNNVILMREEMPASLNTAMSMALRVVKGADNLTVNLPVQAIDNKKRQALETAFQKIYLSRDIYTEDDEVLLMLPSMPKSAGVVKIEVRNGTEVINKFNWNTSAKAEKISIAKPNKLKATNYQVLLSGSENKRELSFKILNAKYYAVPVKGNTYENRRLEVLGASIKYGSEPLDPKSKKPVNMWNSAALRAEIAKMELGRWQDVHPSTLIAFIEGVALVEDGSDFRMLDLIGMQIKFGQHPKYPVEVTAAMKKCALAFRYWADEPGKTSANYFTENHRLAFHASEVLAGQLYAKEIFTNNNQSGEWHRQHGEELALEWLYKRGQYGFEEWDANGYLAADLVLITHLVDLAENKELKEKAIAVNAKIFLSLALNSFKGSFGSTHGRTGVDYVKDARNESISPLAYFGWGVGIVNYNVDSTVALACAKYVVPEVIQAIALEHPEAMWGRERTGLDPILEKRGPLPVDKVTFKTADFMLASAQSWRPGESGYQHHIWQATLGPDSPVFVTHPACISEDGNRRPNFWMGNQTLPRVAQWKDTLISLHQPRAKDWLQWSHAYFPTFAFDEYKIEKQWAFARVGNGYLAITCANGFKLIKKGNSAFRELRSTGGDNIWFCQMGRKALDGSFQSFQNKIKSLPVSYNKLAVKCTNLRGQQLEFGWSTPFMIDGKEQPISNFMHFDTLYVKAPWPAKQLEITHQTKKLVLNFEEKV